MSKVWIDHETGMIHGLPDGPEPLNGPTSGAAYEELKKNEQAHAQRNAMLERQMLSTFQCTQCKRRQSGKYVRVRFMRIGGVDTETLVCFDQKCDAPVVMIQDAGPLMKALKGRVQ